MTISVRGSFLGADYPATGSKLHACSQAANLIGKTSVWRASFGTHSGWSSTETEGSSYGSSFGENRGETQGRGTSSTTSYGGDSMGFSSNSGTSDSRSYGSNYSRNDGRSDGLSGGRNSGMQEQRDYAVEPHEFATELQTGGKANQGVVTGVVVLPGRKFERNGKHWMTIGFRQ